jgi:hypothetical protein
MDGFEWLREIRALETDVGSGAVIAMTAFGTRADLTVLKSNSLRTTVTGYFIRDYDVSIIWRTSSLLFPSFF